MKAQHLLLALAAIVATPAATCASITDGSRNLFVPRRLKGCTAVTPAKCGTDFYDNCLKCGTKSAYDCEKCCPGCSLKTKSSYSYCDCKKGPGPFPPPGGDSWAKYTVAGMDVESVVGGSDPNDYDKVVILLHGGGGSGSDWESTYTAGWFGDMSGIKYVFPTSAIPSKVWYISFKNGCGFNDDCAYNIAG